MNSARYGEKRIAGGFGPPILLVARVAALALVGAVLLVAGCERRPVGESRSGAGPAVARVNGRPLYETEFAARLPDDYQRALTSREQRDYLDRWIATELLYDEALRTHLKFEGEIAARLEQFKKDLVADLLVQKVIREKAVVTDAEVHAYYDERIDEYTKEYRVSHILLNTLEDVERVKGLLEKQAFSWVERRNSVDRHTGVGGDLGFLSKGNMIPEFEQVVFNMEVGEVSDVIESEFGYHLIKLTDVREARGKLEFEEVEEDIYRTLLLAKRAAVYDSLITSLRERADVTILDPRLTILLEDDSTDAGAVEDDTMDEAVVDSAAVTDTEESQ